MTIFNKDPNAVLDYQVDWSAWLGTDTISSVTWLPDAGITKQSQSNTTTTATAWFTGGTAGVPYNVTCRIVTAAGRTDDRSFTILCKDK